MTDREINLAIAELRGWKNCILSPGFACEDAAKFPKGIPPVNQKFGDVAHAYLPIPNYCQDLNAMHEAEKVLSGDDQFGKYLFWLCEVIGSASCRHPVPNACPTATARFILVHATARQRAEAFLRTFGVKS